MRLSKFPYHPTSSSPAPRIPSQDSCALRRKVGVPVDLAGMQEAPRKCPEYIEVRIKLQVLNARSYMSVIYSPSQFLSLIIGGKVSSLTRQCTECQKLLQERKRGVTFPQSANSIYSACACTSVLLFSRSSTAITKSRQELRRHSHAVFLPRL
jgi:hypothetical protein